MPNIDVRKVSCRKEQDYFVCLPKYIYEDCPQWVPDLDRDVRILFDRRSNPESEFCHIQPFVAYRNEVPLGGTLDTGGCHWGKFILHAYQHMAVPVTEEQFCQSYVYAERYVAQHPVILPDDTFRQTLEKKVSLQLQYLQLTPSYLSPLTSYLYQQVCRHISHSRDILQQIAQPKVLVSNFYGNLQTVLHEFSLDSLFSGVIESAVVGVRKPDPAIFALGLESLQLPPDAVAVVGDSIDKDILPATSIGCRTIWFRGKQWTDTLVVPPDACVAINDLSELLTMNSSTN